MRQEISATFIDKENFEVQLRLAVAGDTSSLALAGNINLSRDGVDELIEALAAMRQVMTE